MAVPEKPLSILAPSGTIAVIAPHPDDETLGCGGLIALAVASRRPLVVIVLSDGSASHPGSIELPPAKLARVRSQELMDALAALGCSTANLVQMGLTDGALDQADRAAMISTLVGIFAKRGVGAVFVTGPYDSHPDHRKAFDVAAEAAARVGAALWSYPVRAHVGRMVPKQHAVRLPVGEVLERKTRALLCHATQLDGGVPDTPRGFHLSDEDLSYHLSPHESFFAHDTRGSSPVF